MVRNRKMTDAGYRTIEVLKWLKKQPLSLNDIFTNFLKEYPDTIDTKETILKYINTLRYFGFDIKKFQNCYHLSDNFLQVDYTPEELDTIYILNDYINILDDEILKQNFSVFLTKLENSFSQNSKNLSKEIKLKHSKNFNIDFSKNGNKIQKLTQYIKNGLKLKIEYKNYNNEVITIKVEPISLIYKQDKVFLSVYNQLKGQFQELFIENIISISQLPQKITGAGISKAITFKVFGRLCSKYNLRENEKIIEQGQDYLVILNKFEDTNQFLKRMMKYQDNCEILYPVEIRNEFINLIDKTLEIYSA